MPELSRILSTISYRIPCKTVTTVSSRSQTFYALPKPYNEIRNVAKSFANTVLKPAAANLDKFAEIPTSLREKLAEAGLMSITASNNNGGIGLDILAVAVAVEELSRACASTGAFVSIHNILYVDFLERFGNDYHHKNFLRHFAKGIPGAFAISEFDAGSDVANISSTAKKDSNKFVLNGTKAWVTSGREAEAAIIFASLDKKGHLGLTAFIVPLNAQGVTKGRNERKMGIRGTSTCTINLENVIIPESNMIGGCGKGFELAMKQLAKARIGIASQAVGISQACLDLSLKYASKREVFGRKLVELQPIQFRLAKMCAKIEASRLLVRNAASLCINGKHFSKESSIAKFMAATTVKYCADECVQILGALGYVEDMPAERYYRDAKVTEIYGGTSDIQLKIIFDKLLKEGESPN